MEGSDSSDTEVVAGIVAALALAVDQRRPSYVSGLVPRPSPRLCLRLIDMLRTELIREWADGAALPAASAIVRILTSLEQVRQESQASSAQELGSPLAGSDGLELLVDVVHDLRSPLTSILFLAETLQRGQSGDVNELQHRQLGLMYSAALGLSGLVSDAIEMARGGDELADHWLTPFSVAELLGSVRDIVHPMAEEKGIAVRLVAPACDHRLGHPVALSRALLNLTTNALKFTEHGFVELVCQPKSITRVEFSVRDSGPGINPDTLAGLFQPFRRTRGSSGYCFSGTGLGLAICRKVIEAMGSTLRVETRAGWGTRFFFELEASPVTPIQGVRLPGTRRTPPQSSSVAGAAT